MRNRIKLLALLFGALMVYRSGRRVGVEVCQSTERLRFDGLCYPGRYGKG